MKRTLFESITVIPYTPGDAINRTGFLSAVIGANIASGAEVTVKVEHSDDGKNFVPVTDELVFPEKQTIGGEYTFKNETIKAGGTADASNMVNIDVDLVGLKSIIKFTVSGIDGSLAVVLGDSVAQPV